MKLPVYITLAIGSVGAVAAYLAAADPSRVVLWSTIAGIVSALVPVAHKAVS